MAEVKIIRRDNLDREGPHGDEWLAADHIPSKFLADRMCHALNSDPHSENWFVVVQDDYTLRPPWEP